MAELAVPRASSETLEYDPIKRTLGAFFSKTTGLRILFYRMLDLLLLRSWYIHRELSIWARGKRQDVVDIFDAGSGYGQYTYRLATMGNEWRLFAADVKEEQVADCNELFGHLGYRNRVTFQVEDLVKYRSRETYDLVLCVDVIEHILEDVEVFKNFHASLRPGGMLLISTPSDQGDAQEHADDVISFVGEHVRDGYSAADIQEKLQAAGFSRVEVLYSYGVPGSIAWHLSIKYPMLALNASRLFYAVLPVYYTLVFPFCYVLNSLDVAMNHRKGRGLIVKANRD